MRSWMVGLWIGALVSLGGCSTSTWLLEALYSSADEQLLRDLNSYTEYTPAQQRWLAQSVQSFHLWHRREELPRYAQWLAQIAQALAQTPSKAQIKTWQQQGTEFVHRLPQCSPLGRAAPWLVGLSDRQVQDFERRLAAELAQERKEHSEEPRPERLRQRQANIEKWLRRIGMPMNPSQRQLLEQTLQRSRSMSGDWLVLLEQWQTRFIQLLKARQQAGSEAKIQAHLGQLTGQLARHHPEDWQYNQRLWLDFAQRYLAEQPAEQRAALRQWLYSMSETLLSISRTPVNDAPQSVPAPC